jgi:hypothetical protein
MKYAFFRSDRAMMDLVAKSMRQFLPTSDFKNAIPKWMRGPNPFPTAGSFINPLPKTIYINLIHNVIIALLLEKVKYNGKQITPKL